MWYLITLWENTAMTHKRQELVMGIRIEFFLILEWMQKNREAANMWDFGVIFAFAGHKPTTSEPLPTEN